MSTIEVFSHTVLEACGRTFANRYNFGLDQLTKLGNYKSSTNPSGHAPNPIGLTRFHVKWDVNCDELHERMQYRPPKASLSPYQRFDLLKFCYKHYKLSQSFFYLDAKATTHDEVLRGWKDISISFRISPKNPAAIRFPSPHPGQRHHLKDAVAAAAGNHQMSQLAQDHSQNKQEVHQVYNGDLIPFDLLRQEPYISYSLDLSPLSSTAAETSDPSAASASTSDLYVLVLLCLDYPTRLEPHRPQSFTSGFLHWIVGNIPGTNFASGEEIGPYLALPRGSDHATGDYHRHVAVLFKQNHRITTAEVSSRPFDRSSLQLLPWLQSLDIDLNPIAFSMFLTTTLPLESVHNALIEDHHHSTSLKTSSRRVLPRAVTWTLPSSLPYNHPNNLQTSLESNPITKAIASASSTTGTSKLAGLINELHLSCAMPRELDDDDDDEDDDDEDESSAAPGNHPLTNVESVEEAIAEISQQERSYLFQGLSDYEIGYQSKLLEGEVVHKKFSKDYVSKKRFVWLDAHRQTLNWCRSAKERKDDAKVKSVDIVHTNIQDCGIVSQALGQVIRIAFKSGSMIDLDVICSKSEDPDSKREAWLKLINKVRHHTFQRISVISWSKGELK
jgi:phosphatidylethanolamine-binding protein (PEBP) family uncharacterized protein